MNKKKLFLIILFVSLVLRFINFNFPGFNSEEARLAFRGYTIAKDGKDELGRSTPFIFNSDNDYQLPLVSYLSSTGFIFFGKSEFSARIPFILIGIVLVFLTFKVATQISQDKYFPFWSAFIVASSPLLIFISKIPNEPIVLCTLILLLFYLLNRKKLNLIFVTLVMILIILTSKSIWFSLLPFVCFTLFVYLESGAKSEKIRIALIGVILIFITSVFFLQIPQARRSLSENNLSIFSDISLKNGINKIRGQGRMQGWPAIFDQLLFNKSFYLIGAGINWLSNIQPAVYFGKFDANERWNFPDLGAFPKAAIIPAFFGLVFLIREKKYKFLAFPLILSWPSALIFPKGSPEIVVTTVPFVAFLLAFGFSKIDKRLAVLIAILMLGETCMNLFFLSPQVKATSDSRPSWFKNVVQDINRLSENNQVFVSDDITENPDPLILWYAPAGVRAISLNIPFPYKVRQTKLGKVLLIGASNEFASCSPGEKNILFASTRDFKRISDLNINTVTKNYTNDSGDIKAMLIGESVCLK